jgi:hypothetical protein
MMAEISEDRTSVVLTDVERAEAERSKREVLALITRLTTEQWAIVVAEFCNMVDIVQSDADGEDPHSELMAEFIWSMDHEGV